MKAIARSLHITSKKINLIADLVRMRNVVEALDILKFTPKKGAAMLKKIVKSAMANAENNFKQERPTLFIKEIIVTEGPTLKRSIPVSRGRSNPILKRMAHVTVVLGVRDGSGEESLPSPSKQVESPKKKTVSAKSKKESDVTVTTKKVTAKKKSSKKVDEKA